MIVKTRSGTMQEQKEEAETSQKVVLREYITCPVCKKKMIVYLLKTGEAKTIHACGMPLRYIAGLGEIIITKLGVKA